MLTIEADHQKPVRLFGSKEASDDVPHSTEMHACFNN